MTVPAWMVLGDLELDLLEDGDRMDAKERAEIEQEIKELKAMIRKHGEEVAVSELVLPPKPPPKPKPPPRATA